MVFFQRKYTHTYTKYAPTPKKDQKKTPLVSHIRYSYLCTFIKGGDVLQTGEDGASCEMSAF